MDFTPNSTAQLPPTGEDNEGMWARRRRAKCKIKGEHKGMKGESAAPQARRREKSGFVISVHVFFCERLLLACVCVFE